MRTRKTGIKVYTYKFLAREGYYSMVDTAESEWHYFGITAKSKAEAGEYFKNFVKTHGNPSPELQVQTLKVLEESVACVSETDIGFKPQVMFHFSGHLT